MRLDSSRILAWLRKLVSLPASPQLAWVHVAVPAAPRKSLAQRPYPGR